MWYCGMCAKIQIKHTTAKNVNNFLPKTLASIVFKIRKFLVEHNGLFYWVGASDARHEGTWLWGSGAAVEDFVWMKSKKMYKSC